MDRTTLFRLAGAGAGAVVAAVATGVVVERRVVRTRRETGGEGDSLGALRGDTHQVTTDDGVLLHTEVDEVAPYSEARDREGEATVVFVHGYALTLDCWHFQRQHLRGKRRLVLFDQRSHGRSGHSVRDHATIDQLGHDLRAVLEQVVPRGPVLLVGHSMGGMAVMAFAERHPEVFADRVAGVALFSTAAGGLRPHRILGRFVPDRLGGTVGNRAMALLARAPELVDSARRRGSNVGFVVTDAFAFGRDVPAEYVEFVDDMLSGTSFDVLAEFFPHFAALDKYTVLSAFASVPTLVLGGTKDLLTSIGHSRTMASRITGARLVESPGSGHMVILEDADRVNTALDRLLADAEQRAGEDRAP